MEWTRIRRRPSDHDCGVNRGSKASETEEGVRNRRVDRQHVSAESAGEQEKRHLEHHRETLDEEVQRPLFQPIAFSLAVSAALDHRSTRMPQVPVQPLLPQHRDECSQQRDQETRVYKAGRGDDLARWVSANGWNGGSLAGNGGLVEGEEDCTEEGDGLLVGIRLEVRMNIDGKGGADGRKQTSLREWMRLLAR